jgi:hypothetical protein
VTLSTQRGEGDIAPISTDPCKGTAGTQPDVQTQCDCFGIIKGVSNSTILVATIEVALDVPMIVPLEDAVVALLLHVCTVGPMELVPPSSS